MILSAIFHFFKAVLGVVIKAIAWLLVSLSLWVPLLYALVFLIACGATGASLTALRTWFFVGLALSFVVSFAISNYFYERKLRAKRREKKANGNIEKVKAAEIRASMAVPPPAPAPELSPLEDEPDVEAYAENASSIVKQAKEEALRPQKKTAPRSTDETASKHGFIGYGDMAGPAAGAASANGQGAAGTSGQDGWQNPVSGQFNAQYNQQFGQYQGGNQYNGQPGQFGQGNQYNGQPNQYNQQNYQQYGNTNNPQYGSANKQYEGAQYGGRGNKYGEVEFESYDLHRGESGAINGGFDGFAPVSDSGFGGGKDGYSGQSQNAYKPAQEGFGEPDFSSRGRGFAGANSFEGGQTAAQPHGFEGSQRRFDRGQLAQEKVSEFSAGGYNAAGGFAPAENLAQNYYSEGFSGTENFARAENFTPAQNYTQAENYTQTEGFNSTTFGGAANQSGSAAHGFGRASATDEQPNIFATRHDPTVFIYEYSNRLDYYKRTRSGMIFMHSRPKSAG